MVIDRYGRDGPIVVVRQGDRHMLIVSVIDIAVLLPLVADLVEEARILVDEGLIIHRNRVGRDILEDQVGEHLTGIVLGVVDRAETDIPSHIRPGLQAALRIGPERGIIRDPGHVKECKGERTVLRRLSVQALLCLQRNGPLRLIRVAEGPAGGRCQIRRIRCDHKRAVRLRLVGHRHRYLVCMSVIGITILGKGSVAVVPGILRDRLTDLVMIGLPDIILGIMDRIKMDLAVRPVAARGHTVLRHRSAGFPCCQHKFKGACLRDVPVQLLQGCQADFPVGLILIPEGRGRLSGRIDGCRFTSAACRHNELSGRIVAVVHNGHVDHLDIGRIVEHPVFKVTSVGKKLCPLRDHLTDPVGIASGIVARTIQNIIDLVKHNRVRRSRAGRLLRADHVPGFILQNKCKLAVAHGTALEKLLCGKDQLSVGTVGIPEYVVLNIRRAEAAAVFNDSHKLRFIRSLFLDLHLCQAVMAVQHIAGLLVCDLLTDHIIEGFINIVLVIADRRKDDHHTVVLHGLYGRCAGCDRCIRIRLIKLKGKLLVRSRCFSVDRLVGVQDRRSFRLILVPEGIGPGAVVVADCGRKGSVPLVLRDRDRHLHLVVVKGHAHDPEGAVFLFSIRRVLPGLACVVDGLVRDHLLDIIGIGLSGVRQSIIDLLEKSGRCISAVSVDGCRICRHRCIALGRQAEGKGTGCQLFAAQLLVRQQLCAPFGFIFIPENISGALIRAGIFFGHAERTAVIVADRHIQALHMAIVGITVQRPETARRLLAAVAFLYCTPAELTAASGITSVIV